MENRFVNALVKTVIFLVIAHIVVVILGLIFGREVNLFGLRVFWAHWTGGPGNATVSAIATVVTYFIIYCFFTHDTHSEIEEK